jgi:hypothetical protein
MITRGSCYRQLSIAVMSLAVTSSYTAMEPVDCVAILLFQLTVHDVTDGHQRIQERSNVYDLRTSENNGDLDKLTLTYR